MFPILILRICFYLLLAPVVNMMVCFAMVLLWAQLHWSFAVPDDRTSWMPLWRQAAVVTTAIFIMAVWPLFNSGMAIIPRSIISNPAVLDLFLSVLVLWMTVLIPWVVRLIAGRET